MDERAKANHRWAQEARYIARLLEDRRTDEVCEANIESYLKVQIKSAKRDRFFQLEGTLQNALDAWYATQRRTYHGQRCYCAGCSAEPPGLCLSALMAPRMPDVIAALRAHAAALKS